MNVNTMYGITMKGGKFIGVGSYGCVISPIIKCNNNQYNKNGKNISKLVTYKSYDIDDLEDIYDEINTGKKIQSIDKNNKYLSPIISYCILQKNKIKKRNDIKYNIVDDEDALDDELELLLSHKSHRKNGIQKCLININKYIIIINLTINYSGIDLTIIFRYKEKYKKELLIFKNSYKKTIKHMLGGLELLHKHHIVHKDIKLDNLCLSINNNIVIIKYIDFGLSHNLKYIDKTLNNINYSGTPCYSPPDYVILTDLIRSNFNNITLNKRTHYKIIKKLFNSIKSNFSTFTNKGLNKSYLSGNIFRYTTEKNLKSSKSLSSSSDTSLFSQLNIKKNNYFISLNDINNLFYFLLNLYNKDELLNYYFNNKNGLLSKVDIFSTGLVIFEISSYLDINNILLVNLIKNMIELNSINRYNIDDCIKHIFFQ